jgi:hypothetical protein
MLFQHAIFFSLRDNLPLPHEAWYAPLSLTFFSSGNMILFFKIPSSSFTNILLIKIHHLLHQKVHALTVTFFSLRNTIIFLFIKKFMLFHKCSSHQETLSSSSPSPCSYSKVLLIEKHHLLLHKVFHAHSHQEPSCLLLHKVHHISIQSFSSNIIFSFTKSMLFLLEASHQETLLSSSSQSQDHISILQLSCHGLVKHKILEHLRDHHHCTL